ncbi:hypothetical protein [uncultured Clostridium sp.]|uniref:hypothetical protein n=1 Tax=uncultured Clostridium sp. TaxID=59620 RepID=UPI0028EB858A|nr:hypothetical protein [uncultured Clostridium sp.]
MEKAIESLIALDQEVESYLEIKEREIVQRRDDISKKAEQMWKDAEEELKTLKNSKLEEYERRTNESRLTIKKELEEKSMQAKSKYKAIKNSLVEYSINYIINSSKGE